MNSEASFNEILSGDGLSVPQNNQGVCNENQGELCISREGGCKCCCSANALVNVY